VSSYVYSLSAILEKIRNEDLDKVLLERYTSAQQSASAALQTLREANLLVGSPQEADKLASEGIDLLKKRYTSKRTRTKRCSIKIVPNRRAENFLASRLEKLRDIVSRQ
jgi:hypothetical protein